MSLAAVLTLAVSITEGAPPPRPGPPPRPKDGEYVLTVAGMARGSGSASVSGDQLTITADVVRDGGGGGGKISATLPVVNNHFQGPGTVMGVTATFKGRIDQPADANEKTINGVRLTCTFKTANGEYGRIIGNLPSKSPSPRPRPTPPGNGKGDGDGDAGKGDGDKDKDKDKDKGKDDGGSDKRGRSRGPGGRR